MIIDKMITEVTTRKAAVMEDMAETAIVTDTAIMVAAEGDVMVDMAEAEKADRSDRS